MIRRFWTSLVQDWTVIGRVFEDAAKPAPEPEKPPEAPQRFGEMTDPRDTTRDGW